ncbi:MAG TPA: hypothetical protein VLM16_08055, partial [Ginsengibacter sp.]|nr:hypothetical protein [Ginsengibacter sp.]
MEKSSFKFKIPRQSIIQFQKLLTNSTRIQNSFSLFNFSVVIFDFENIFKSFVKKDLVNLSF